MSTKVGTKNQSSIINDLFASIYCISVCVWARRSEKWTVKLGDGRKQFKKLKQQKNIIQCMTAIIHYRYIFWNNFIPEKCINTFIKHIFSSIIMLTQTLNI